MESFKKFAKEYKSKEKALKGLDNSSLAKRKNLIEKGKKDFRTYCSLRNPDFFKKDRAYQDDICNTLQAAFEKRLINPKNGEPYDIVIISEPPGFGKSYTASNFITWAYGKNPKLQVISVSYNQTLSLTFSKSVREAINDEEIKGDDNYFVVNSFFPDVNIKYGDGAVQRWSLEGSYMSYLATSFDGSITGMRGHIGIIDDPIKNAADALNDNVKDNIWNFYKNTFASRILDGGLTIVIQTRWASDDLAGRLLSNFPDRCFELKLKALDDKENSICESLYSTKDLLTKRATLDEDIWLANYMQEPIDKKGALYGKFKTYDVLDLSKAKRIVSYIDTADTGADYLCAISACVIGGYAYVLDVYYTDESMEVTELEVARRLQLYGVREAVIESNNGGRGFARNVSRILKSVLKCYKTNVLWFNQTKNKKTRILVNASNVMEQVIMPEAYESKYPLFSEHVKKFQRKGKNEHDDAEDTLTGLVELINGEIKVIKKARIPKEVLGDLMYRFEINEVLDEKFLTKLVDKFRNNELRHYEKLDRYYMSRNDAIKNRQMKNGKPNNKIAHGFCRYITNMATSYFLGKPIEYSFDNIDESEFNIDEYKKSLKSFLNDTYNYDYEISKSASKMGIAFELLYIDEKGQLKTKDYDATSIIPIFSSSVDEYLNACIRLYERRDIDGNLLCDFADVYDKSDIYRFKRTNKLKSYELYDIQRHYLSDVPFIVYLNNKEALSDYECVIDLIDAYDKAQSNTANDMDYFTDAYLVVTGAGGGFSDDEGEDIEDSKVERSLRNSRVIYLDEKGDAKFLVKGSDTSSSEAYKERLFKHIFFTSQVPAMTDESFAGDLSGVAIKYKLIGLEQLAIMKENAMRLAKTKKLKIITDFINFKKSSKFDVGVIRQKYTRNFIDNVSDTIDDTIKLTNIISKKSQLEILPKSIIKDVDSELERIKLENNDSLFVEE